MSPPPDDRPAAMPTADAEWPDAAAWPPDLAPVVQDTMCGFREDPALTALNVRRLLAHAEAGASLRDLVRSEMSLPSVLLALTSAVHRGQMTIRDGPDGGGAIWLGPQGLGVRDWRGVTAFARRDATDPRLADLRRILSGSARRYDPAYFQSRDTFESLERRFLLMASFGDDWVERLAVLGDDALFGLYFALAGQARSIVVADADPQLLSFARRAADELDVRNITFIRYDVRTAPPDELVARHDRFVVSGFKDLGGLLLFLARGLASLREPVTGRAGYFTYGSHELDTRAQDAVELGLQKTLSDLGCVIDAVCPCVETEPPEAVLRDFAAIIRRASGIDDPTERGAAVLAALEALREPHADVSWLARTGYPRIRLAPIKAARLRLLGPLPPLARRLGRLAQMKTPDHGR